jgi:hypothetical protein
MAMAATFNTGQDLLADPQRVWSYARGRLRVKREVRRPKLRSPVPINDLTYLHEILSASNREATIMRYEL